MTQKDKDHKANQANSNLGTPGINPAYANVHGNRGKQLNPNYKPKRK